MVGGAHPARMLGGAHPACHPRPTRSGFTLVELLVSIGLTIFMLTLFAVLFQSGGEAVKNARGISEADKQVRGVVVKLKRDLQNVFLGDGVSLAHIYERHGPGAGYFTIEENFPGSPPYYLGLPISEINSANIPDGEVLAAVQFLYGRLTKPGNSYPYPGYRQGVDSRGLPVEVDVDDVLAFTVRLTGNSPETVFTGRVPVGSILDNGFSPESRFDEPNNGLFTSPLAEVIYFLRPDRPYSLEQINNPAIGVNENRNTTPATYTLYRRELLLLSDGQRQSLEYSRDPASGVATPTGGVYPLEDLQSAIPNNPSINVNPSWYQHYDVSVYFGYNLRIVPTGAQDLLNLANYTLRWNSPETIRQRRNRYGMRWLGYTGPNGDQSPGDPSFAPVDPDGAVPDYDHISGVNASRAGIRAYVPSGDPATAMIWHGRPTLFESTLIGAEGINPANYNPTYNSGRFAALTPGSGSDVFSSGSGNIARRSGGDVVLRNVLSFDVKILNDDLVPGEVTAQGLNSLPLLNFTELLPSAPLDPMDWPAFKTMRFPPRDAVRSRILQVNPAARVGFPSANTSRKPVYQDLATPIPTTAIQPDFIDLGVGLYAERMFFFNGNLLQPNNTPIRAYTTDLGYNPNLFQSIVAPGLYRYEPPPPNNPNQAPPANEPIPRRVPWGRHFPARWESSGRPESSSAFYTGYATNALRSTYDTWAPEYYPENFLTRNPGPSPPADPLAFTPPYDRPLRGVQITLRVLEPTSGIVREFQVVHRFE